MLKLNMNNSLYQPKNITLSVIFEEAPEGGYTVSVPQLPGCVSEGDTFEEAKTNITDAINLYVNDLSSEEKDKLANNQEQVIVAQITIPQSNE